jgi:hypothetical protein
MASPKKLNGKESERKERQCRIIKNYGLLKREPNRKENKRKEIKARLSHCVLTTVPSPTTKKSVIQSKNETKDQKKLNMRGNRLPPEAPPTSQAPRREIERLAGADGGSTLSCRL